MKSRHSFNDGHSHEASNKARAPRGTVLMYVNGGNERRAVPIPYLSHPLFLDLLERAENEYGLSQKGALLLPCSLEELDQILRSIAASHHKHLGYSLRD
ncbi:hypothetical protein KP509_35G059200 [Ceratopteris richardii]|nr:hypothetical protein KP509_35G059200 [Ceratopteris richardii]